MNMQYFNQLGYKTSNSGYNKIIIEDFQRHAGIKADGLIGPVTRSAMAKYNKSNFCPEVFEPIKPYIPYTDEELESLMGKNLVGLGAAFNYFSRENDFDALHNINHAILESDSGTSKIARDKNNLYGWAAYDTSAYDSASKYKDFTDCIDAWSKKYNMMYLEPTGKHFRGNSEYGVNIVYASSPVAGVNKSFITQQLRNRLLAGSPITYLPNDRVPGASDFTFKEGYSNVQINGIRRYKVDPIPLDLIDNAIRVFQNLQKIRTHFNAKVVISQSGNLYRNDLYNLIAGGKPDSRHRFALAVDCYVVGVSSREVFSWARENTDFKGFGIINSMYIHLDLRDKFWYQEY